MFTQQASGVVCSNEYEYEIFVKSFILHKLLCWPRGKLTLNTLNVRERFLEYRISAAQFIHNLLRSLDRDARIHEHICGVVFPLLIINRISEDVKDDVCDVDPHIMARVLPLYISGFTSNVLFYFINIRQYILCENYFGIIDYIEKSSWDLVKKYASFVNFTPKCVVEVPSEIEIQLRVYENGINSIMKNTNYFTCWLYNMNWEYYEKFKMKKLNYLDASMGLNSNCLQLILHLFLKYGVNVVRTSSSYGNEKIAISHLVYFECVSIQPEIEGIWSISCTDDMFAPECKICEAVLVSQYTNSGSNFVIFANMEVYMMALTLYNVVINSCGSSGLPYIWDTRLHNQSNLYDCAYIADNDFTCHRVKVNAINVLSQLSQYNLRRMSHFDKLINSKVPKWTREDKLLVCKQVANDVGFTKRIQCCATIRNDTNGVRDDVNVNIIDKNKVLTLKMIVPNIRLVHFFDEQCLSEKATFVRHSNSITTCPSNGTFSRYKVRDVQYGGGDMNTYNINISGSKLDALLMSKVIELNLQKIARRRIFPSTVVNTIVVRNNCTTVDSGLGGILNEFMFRDKYKSRGGNISGTFCKNLKVTKVRTFPAYNTYVHINFNEVKGSYNIPLRDRQMIESELDEKLVFEMQIHRRNLNTSKLYGSELCRCVLVEINNILNSKDKCGKNIVEYDVALNNVKADIERRSNNLLCKSVNLFLELCYLFFSSGELDQMLNNMFFSRDMISTYGEFSLVCNYGFIFRKENAHFVSRKYHIPEIDRQFEIDVEMLFRIYEQMPFDLGILHKHVMEWIDSSNNGTEKKIVIKYPDNRSTGILGYMLFGSKRFLETFSNRLITRIRGKSLSECDEYIHMINSIESYKSG